MASSVPAIAVPANYPWPATNSLVAGDWNSDGALDLAIGGYGVPVAVALGHGDGTFAPSVEYLPVGQATEIATGDMDGDGSLDLVVADFHADAVSVLLGNGDGTFEPGLESVTVVNPVSILTGDANGDGNLDVFTSNGDANTVSVLLGNGDGTFASRLDHYCGIFVQSVAAGHLDGDGTLDLIVLGSDLTDSVPTNIALLGAGDGTFSAQVDQSSDDWRSVAIGDMNGDGRSDLVFASSHCYARSWVAPFSTVGVALGNGDGTHALPLEQSFSGCCLGDWLALGDLNGDGALDAVAGGGRDGCLLLGAGDGTFQPDPAPVAGGELALGDWNRDGNLDLASTLGETQWINVLLGAGDGTMHSWVASEHPTIALASSLVLADLNGDDHLDLAVPGEDIVEVLYGAGDGTLVGSATFPTGASPQSAAAGDVNRDGHVDLVTANEDGFTVSVLLGTDAGILAAKQDYPAGDLEASQAPRAIAMGDLDGDGSLDIVTANTDSTSVLLGRGDGTFAPKTDYPASSYLHSVALGDLDGDGNLDVVVDAAPGSTASVQLGAGDGTLGPTVDVGLADGFSQFVTVEDLNGDGRLDLVTEVGDSTIRVLLGAGDGTFAPHADYYAPSGGRYLALGDVSGDGNIDLVVAGTVTTLMLGAGDGTFWCAQSVAAQSSAVGLGDMDTDGTLDLAYLTGERGKTLAKVVLNPR